MMRFKSALAPLVIGIPLYSLILPFCYAHGISEAERQAIKEGGNLSYMQIGAMHMLTGYDHLLFVFGMVFFLYTLRDIVKYVTAFTLGHSITLIFATFYAIQLNYFLIDAVVGLSVCYIAFSNIDGFRKYLNIHPPNILAMIAGFGLVHGFGLSSRLQELPLSENGLLINIISFNIGIELGQLAALLVMILIIDLWRNSESFKRFGFISNYVLILAGALLFLMQMHGYAHTSMSEETSAFVDTGIDQAVTSSPQAPAQWQDLIAINIPAMGSKEYKFHLEKGSTFQYAWETNQQLYYDFHGEPDGNTTGFFDSYEENTASQGAGSLTAPFTGIHGWYWKNDTAAPVTIFLKATGNYQRIDIAEKPAVETVPTYVPIPD